MKKLAFAILTLSAGMALAQLPPEPEAPAPPPPTDPAPPPTDPTTTPPPPPPPPLPPPSPGQDVAPAKAGVGPLLPNMMPVRVGTTVDVRADYTHLDLFDDEDSDLFLMAMNFFGSYIAKEGYGAYIQIPYFYASVDGGSEDESDSTSGFGNLELGGLYIVPQGPNSQIVARGGIALDTAGLTASLYAPFSNLGNRLYDAYPTGLQSMWARGHVSFRHSEGTLRLGATGGIDVPFTKDEDSFISTEIDAIGAIAVSAGFEQPGFSFGIGFVMMQAFGVDDEGENITGLNAVGGVPVSPTMSLYFGFGVPDLENADELNIWGVGVGLRAAVL